MSQTPLDLIDTCEFSGPGVQSGPSSSPNEANGQVNDSSEEPIRNPNKLSRKKPVDVFQYLVLNSRALASRFIQLCLKPEGLASIILDFWSSSLSIIWIEKHSGLDLLYPFSSLTKQKSGRLARLLLEHSRRHDKISCYFASSRRNSVGSRLVSVIDLSKVPSDVFKRRYTISADFYGFVVMVVFLEIFIFLILYTIRSPIELGPYIKWLGGWVTYLFGDWIGAWFVSFTSLVLSEAMVQGVYVITDAFILFCYAVLRGECVLTLVQTSDESAPDFALLLDRDLTGILIGPQCVVEAVAEGSFTMFQPFVMKSLVERWPLYEALEALCQGVPFAILAGFWLLLNPTSFLMAIVPLVLIAVVSLTRIGATIRSRIGPPTRYRRRATTRYFVSAAPTFLLIVLYGIAMVQDPLLRVLFPPTIWFRLVPYIFVIINLISAPNYHIRTQTLLDILDSPPTLVCRFDTLAAAATFQCLVLCDTLPRPIEIMDVSALLDTLVPDDRNVWKVRKARDVWMVWKARVADRITHEVDISFAPTLPSFGDERQEHLKDLLDEAQIGYYAYRKSHGQYVPMRSARQTRMERIPSHTPR